MKPIEPITWESASWLTRTAASKPGQVLILVLAAILMQPAFGYYGAFIALAVMAAGNLPARRRYILSGIAIVIFLTGAIVGTRDLKSAKWVISALLCFLCVQWLFAQAIPHLSESLRHHSVSLFHALMIAFLGVVWLLRFRAVISLDLAMSLALLATELLWRGSYWVRWQVRENGKGEFFPNLFALIPFLGRGGIPYGKGPDFFTRYEAVDRGQLAISRLKGIHYLALALAWSTFSGVMLSVFSSVPGQWVPGLISNPLPITGYSILPNMYELFQDPSLLALWKRWGGLLEELMRIVLLIAVTGHRVIALYCLAGFAIPRNTNNPFLANSLVDFWARYWFYFKEVLMDFFFFPAYLRLHKLSLIPRTLVAATAAALVGNFYFHLFVYAPELMKPHGGDFLGLLSMRLIFCAALAAGVCWSFTFLLLRKGDEDKSRLGRYVRLARTIRLPYMAGATIFFALLHIWTFGTPAITLRERLHLLLALFDPS